MTKSISIIRIAVLLGLAAAGMLLYFTEEHDTATLAFCLHVVLDKALAIISIFVCIRLYKIWRRTDPWISAYDKWCDDPDTYLNDRKED